MKAKTYLMQIKKFDTLIKNKLDEVVELRERAESITVPIGGKKIKSSSAGDNLERVIIKMVDLGNEIEGDVTKLVDLKKEAISVIDSLENANEIDLLYKRYIKFEQWDAIADKMNYSIQGIFKLHGIALQKIQRIIDEKDRSAKSGVK